MFNEQHAPPNDDIRVRYWAYLFDNLKRAVDEIYLTIQHDKSTHQCKVNLLLFVQADCGVQEGNQ